MAWGPIPCDEDNLGFKELDIFTDGSAVLGGQWPCIPQSAGWSVLFFAKTHEQVRFLGALWGSVVINQNSSLYLGATRPTSPVAELTAITIALKVIRAIRFQGKVTWVSVSFAVFGNFNGSCLC